MIRKLKKYVENVLLNNSDLEDWSDIKWEGWISNPKLANNFTVSFQQCQRHEQTYREAGTPMSPIGSA